MNGQIAVALEMHGASGSVLFEVLEGLGVTFVDHPPADPRGEGIGDLLRDLSRHFTSNAVLPGYFSPLPTGWFKDPVAIDIANALRKSLGDAVKDSSRPVGIHGPELISLLPFLQQLFMALDIEPVYFLETAAPVETDTSFQAMDNWAHAHAEAALLTHGKLHVFNLDEPPESAPQTVKRLAGSLAISDSAPIEGMIGFLEQQEWSNRPPASDMPDEVRLLYAPFSTPATSSPEAYLEASNRYLRSTPKDWLWGDHEGEVATKAPDAANQVTLLRELNTHYRDRIDEIRAQNRQLAKESKDLQDRLSQFESLQDERDTEFARTMKAKNEQVQEYVIADIKKTALIDSWASEVADKEDRLTRMSAKVEAWQQEVASHRQSVAQMESRLTRFQGGDHVPDIGLARYEACQDDFPSLKKLIPDHFDKERRLRVCIVTPDIFGPIRNGGIGTAHFQQARMLADAGHDVTIFYTLGDKSDDGPITKWVEFYETIGITFVPAPAPSLSSHGGFLCQRLDKPRITYEALKGMEPFDIVHAPEWQGHIYTCLVARELGLAFQDTVFCTTVHSPHLWNLEGNAKFTTNRTEMLINAMERMSVELADMVVGPSQHILRWSRDHGFALPEGRTFMQQNIVPFIKESKPDSQRQSIRELVFFGRFDPRKGIDIFTDCVTALLNKRDVQDLEITFLGRESGFFDTSQVNELRQQWGITVNLITDFNSEQAQEYLKEPGRLAIIPSRLDNAPMTVLECLFQEIPFITSDRGGIPELISKTSWPDVIFQADAPSLTRLLCRILDQGAVIPIQGYDFQENIATWLDFHAALAGDKSIVPGFVSEDTADADSPLVSVCLIHYNRPDRLANAIRSVEEQTYGNIELVLVDDGSPAPEAQGYLDSLEPIFREREWKLIRALNGGPGVARNTGAEAASGKYILFLDDDNCIKPHGVETFVSAAESSDADVLPSYLDAYDCEEYPSNEDVFSRLLFMGPDLGSGLLLNVFGDTFGMWRRDVFLSIGKFMEEYRVGREDHELYARAVFMGYKLLVVPEALCWYHFASTDRRSVYNSLNLVGPIRLAQMYKSFMPAHLRSLIDITLGAEARLNAIWPSMKHMESLRKDFAMLKSCLANTEE